MNDLISKFGTQLITGFIAICGIILGLFWNQFFTWRRHKREQKSKLNHLLFHLLELHHFVVRNDFTSFIEIYMSQIETRFGVLSQEERNQIKHTAIPVIKEKINSFRDTDEIKRLSEHYELAVKEIASINPFLAYRLAGQSQKLNNFNLMNDYFDSVKHLLPSEEGQQLLRNITDNYSDDRFIKEMITDVKDSIINVSKEIGIYKKMQALGYLSRQEKSMNEDIKKEITNIIDQIEVQIQKQNKV